MLKKSLLIFLFSLFSFSSFAQFEVSPNQKFKVQRAGIFEVIYNAQQQDLADFYTQKLLDAEKILRPEFQYFPKKLIVILNDKTDVTNGYATRIPYPHLMIYPVVPGPTESLADYGDWVLEFLVHEIVHILNFEPATGLAKYLRPVFGSILAPNLLLPQWWKEGLAVHYESKALGKGRLNSPFQDAQVRAWVQSDQLFDFDLAEINEAIPTWPRGMRPYLFGSLFWADLTEKYGPQVADQLNQQHGGRIPYFLNGATENLLDLDYEKLYNNALKTTSEKARAQIATLEKISPTAHQEFKNVFLYSTLPSVAPSGKWMAFIGTDRRDRRFLKIYEKQDGLFKESRSAVEIRNDENEISLPRHEAPDSGSIQRVSWFHQKNQMIYDKIDAVNSIQRLSDLYIYNFDLKKTMRLTHSGRAREASVAPSDSRIVFIDTKGGRTRLILMDLETKQSKVLLTSEIGERLSTPEFMDEDHIIFAHRQSPGIENLLIYSVLTQSLKELESAGNMARFPVVRNQKLYYLSAKNGTYNVYVAPVLELDAEAAHQPLTHSLTTLTSFSVDQTDETLYFTEMTANGPQIRSLTENARISPATELPKITGLFQSHYSKPVTPTSSTANAKDSKDTKLPTLGDLVLPESPTAEDYQPVSYLMPQYWIPFVATSSTTGGLVFQATTSGFDPLKKHNYAVTLSYDTLLGKLSAAGQYLNTQNEIPFLILASEVNSFLGDLENTVVDQNFQFSLLPDIWSLNRYSSLQLSYRLNNRSVQDAQIKRSGPSIFGSYVHISKGGDQISPAQGHSLYAGVTRYLPGGDNLDHHLYLLGGSLYSDLFLPERHAWLLRLNFSHIPEAISDIYGAQTESFTLDSDTVAPVYLMRGLNSGEIFGRSLAVLNAEYRFPISQIYAGHGTRPYFLKELWGALVVDAASTQGRVLSLKESRYVRVDLDQIFLSYGGELHLETSLGYLFPMGFVLGYFYTPEAYDGPQSNLRLSLQFSL